jgi:hypothetical protein
MAPDGRFVVAWTTNYSGPGAFDIAAQRFTASATRTGTEFEVNSYTTGWQYNESVALDDAGGFVVVWDSEGQDGSYFGVFGQRFDAAGSRVGGEFQVNETTLNNQWRASVGMRADGEFVVVWGSSNVFARRYGRFGSPHGGEFQVNTNPESGGNPSIAFDRTGSFVVVWQSGSPPMTIRGRLFAADGMPRGLDFVVAGVTFPLRFSPRAGYSGDGSFVVAWQEGGLVFARRFDPNGTPLGAEFRVSQQTTGQDHVALAVNFDGDFVAVWDNGGNPSSQEIWGRRFDASGNAGPEFRVNTYTTGFQTFPSVAGDPAGNFVVVWHSVQNGASGVFAQRYAGGLSAAGLVVDGSSSPTSDGNRVLEAGETVAIAPSWLNADESPQAFTGAATAFTGPGTSGNPTYSIDDAIANYGTVATGDTASCAAMGDCYVVGISVPSARPALHWDATFREELLPANLGGLRNWTVHVGDSFADVPRPNIFYRFVETLLHHGVTGGCAATTYCPGASTTREQMAAFVLVAKEGAGYVPPACLTQPFDDVPVSSPFCPWIAELARRGVVGGCVFSNYCPTAPVSRAEMAVFVLSTREPGVTPPACGPISIFSDVPAIHPFCRWIEELSRRGVVSGCGGGAYCPAAPVTREQMAVFLTVAFGLSLYGP